jgi:hypothetical protein
MPMYARPRDGSENHTRFELRDSKHAMRNEAIRKEKTFLFDPDPG